MDLTHGACWDEGEDGSSDRIDQRLSYIGSGVIDGGRKHLFVAHLLGNGEDGWFPE
jgi:hypothetical protein